MDKHLRVRPGRSCHEEDNNLCIISYIHPYSHDADHPKYKAVYNKKANTLSMTIGTVGMRAAQQFMLDVLNILEEIQNEKD